MEGFCCPLRIVSSVFNEGTIKGSSVARGCDVVVLVARLGCGSALPYRRTGMRIPWLIGDCQFCGGLWGGTGHKTRCLLWIGATGGGDSGGVLLSSRGALVGTWPDGSVTSCGALAPTGSQWLRASQYLGCVLAPVRTSRGQCPTPDCHMYCSAASRSPVCHGWGIGGLNIQWEIVVVGRRGSPWSPIGDCPGYWGHMRSHRWAGGKFHGAPPRGVCCSLGDTAVGGDGEGPPVWRFWSEWMPCFPEKV